MRKQKVVMQKMRNPRLAAEQEKMRRRHGGAIARACVPAFEPGGHVAEERHFTPTEIAKMWGVSVWTVRKMFANVPGVLKIGTKGKYVSLHIPARIFHGYHARLSQKSRWAKHRKSLFRRSK
jgi:hypothetical protein